MKKEIDGVIYYRKSDGSLVPEDTVKDTDKLRDQTVYCIAEKILNMRQEMIKVKADVIEDIDAFMETMSEQYGVNLGGDKGNLTLSSYDGGIKIQYYNNEYITFNEGILIAKQLIDEYLTDATRNAPSSLKQIVESAFNMRQGKMDVKQILKLRSLNIDDSRWVKAMQIIDESKQVHSGRKSLRLYMRNRHDEFEVIPLDFTLILGEEDPYQDESGETTSA